MWRWGTPVRKRTEEPAGGMGRRAVAIRKLRRGCGSGGGGRETRARSPARIDPGGCRRRGGEGLGRCCRRWGGPRSAPGGGSRPAGCGREWWRRRTGMKPGGRRWRTAAGVGPGWQGARSRAGAAGKAPAAVRKGAKSGMWVQVPGRRRASGARATGAEGLERAGRRRSAGGARTARG